MTPLEMIGARSHMENVADVHKWGARRAVANLNVKPETGSRSTVTSLELIGARSHMENVADVYTWGARRAVATACKGSALGVVIPKVSNMSKSCSAVCPAGIDQSKLWRRRANPSCTMINPMVKPGQIRRPVPNGSSS